MKSKVLVFAFKGLVSEKVAKLLGDRFDIAIIDSTVADIERFIQETNFDSYDYILGMGMYSGRDKAALRIETVCTNQFRNNKESLDVKPIPYFLQPSDGIKIVKGIGNSWCNLVSYKLVSVFPEKPYTFIHVPKKFATKKAGEIIISQLTALA